MPLHLEKLTPGESFATMSGKEGTLLKLGLGSATVRWHGTERERSFTPAGGEPVTLKSAAREEYIALRTEVRRIG